MNELNTPSVNPLYEKLYHRFSHGGKTVGEVMLARARAAEAAAGTVTVDPCDITAEMRITRANFLPAVGDGATAIRRPLRRRTAIRRLTPSALLSALLAILIATYLLFAGIGHHSDTTPDFRAAYAAEVEPAEGTVLPE